MHIIKSLFSALIFLALSSCDAGLAPVDPTLSGPGFSGRIYFTGQWPSDIKLTYIVMFKNPLLNSSDFNALNLKFVSDAIPFGTQLFEFNTAENTLFGKVEAGDFAYLAVAQSTSATLNLNRKYWRVAGVYKNSNLPEGNISLPGNRFLTNIDIYCDFNNPPVQPPGF